MPAPLHVKPPPDRTFKVFRQLNTPAGRAVSGRRDRMAPCWDHHFPGDGLPDQLARAMSARRAIDIKEFCEAFEFFERVRKAVRAPVMADLCCGHGLTGLLFAAFERGVERVILVDRKRPPSHAPICEAVAEVAPWALEKIEYRQQMLRKATLPAGTGVVAVHACGPRTDRSLRLAVEAGGPAAVMPCCHSVTRGADRPLVFDEAIGRELAVDIDRTYQLRAAGYDVQWTAVPRCVTAMNRVIIATPPAAQPAASPEHRIALS